MLLNAGPKFNETRHAPAGVVKNISYAARQLKEIPGKEPGITNTNLKLQK
jgi:hypothetical protein